MDDGHSTDIAPAALVITHPGHELLVHGWLSTHRPLVLVLTHGGDRETLQATASVVTEAGGSLGRVFGRMGDDVFERALLSRDHTVFHALATDLACELVRHRVTMVVGDSAEGECLAHDLGRAVINTAVAIAEIYLTRRIDNLQFPLLARSEPADGERATPGASKIERLDSHRLAAKLQAARHYQPVPDEFQRLIHEGRERVLVVETLTAVRDERAVMQRPEARPAYERQGERQAAAGRSRGVVRYYDHVMPLIFSLRHLLSAA